MKGEIDDMLDQGLTICSIGRVNFSFAYVTENTVTRSVLYLVHIIPMPSSEKEE